jgi:hypothetical protein
MDAPAPLPPEVLGGLPPVVVAFMQWQSDQIVHLTAHIAKRDARIAELEATAQRSLMSNHQRKDDMERADIKRWQAKKIESSLHPSLNYLFRLFKRMEKKGFLPGDPWERVGTNLRG